MLSGFITSCSLILTQESAFGFLRDSIMPVNDYMRNITMIENLINTDYENLVRFA